MKRDCKIYEKLGRDGKEGTKILKTLEINSKEDAISATNDMRSQCHSDQIYWDYVVENVQLDDDGNEVARADSFNELENILSLKESKIDKVLGIFSVLYYRAKDLVYAAERGIQRMFTGFDYVDAYNIDSHIIRHLLHNLPKMIDNLSGYPGYYQDNAEKIVNSIDGGCQFEIYPDKSQLIANIAMALWKTRLENILLCSRLYQYYIDYGIQEKDSDDFIDPIKFPIPKVECTEDMIDYDKLSELTVVVKNKLMDFLKEDFGGLWD